MGPSLKLAVLSATVLTTAVMFSLSSPFITNFSTSDIPFIWETLVAWLKPPYLYVVLNCIIITIVASSRLHTKLDCEPTEPVKTPLEIQHVHQPEVHFPQPVDISDISVDAGYNNELSINSNSNLSSKFVEVLEPEFSTLEVCDIAMDEEMKIAKEAYEEIKKNKVNKSTISMSVWSPSERSFLTEKPPASARFSHRKPAKAAPEGGRTLGVAKPKRQDTLETTWKAITEGRSVPLTRHLRKSDTWETHGTRSENQNSDVFSTETHPERMTKSDTFNGTTTNMKKSVKPPPVPSKLARSGGSGRLKKEPSLGQEELNRRVEAFIKKFNEDMRLQRQESLNRFMEMINRGA